MSVRISARQRRANEAANLADSQGDWKALNALFSDDNIFAYDLKVLVPDLPQRVRTSISEAENMVVMAIGDHMSQRRADVLMLTVAYLRDIRKSVEAKIAEEIARLAAEELAIQLEEQRRQQMLQEMNRVQNSIRTVLEKRKRTTSTLEIPSDDSEFQMDVDDENPSHAQSVTKSDNEKEEDDEEDEDDAALPSAEVEQEDRPPSPEVKEVNPPSVSAMFLLLFPHLIFLDRSRGLQGRLEQSVKSVRNSQL